MQRKKWEKLLNDSDCVNDTGTSLKYLYTDIEFNALKTVEIGFK